MHLSSSVLFGRCGSKSVTVEDAILRSLGVLPSAFRMHGMPCSSVIDLHPSIALSSSYQTPFRSFRQSH